MKLLKEPLIKSLSVNNLALRWGLFECRPHPQGVGQGCKAAEAATTLLRSKTRGCVIHNKRLATKGCA
ncbi:MAG: hypothetical protein K8F27_14475, partial [Sulfuricellaceae bacterium]|nr:hypothetical protein [Sulfuricellaceae bacterium]